MDQVFEGMPYPPERIKKYICNLNFFMFQLDSGELVPFTTENKDSLIRWLQQNNIPDVRDMDSL